MTEAILCLFEIIKQKFILIIFKWIEKLYTDRKRFFVFMLLIHRKPILEFQYYREISREYYANIYRDKIVH